MRDIIIYEILIPALNKLYHTDYDNIHFGVSERNVCARLAHHMENIMRSYDNRNHKSLFRKYFADVEYNRMGDGEKKQYENNLHRPQYMVSDLLIQSRGRERNYLAVEMKRKGCSTNTERDKDRQRIASLVSSRKKETDSSCVHDTLIGAFIVYSPKDVTVELYENENGEGVMTGELYFSYCHNNRCLLMLSRE